MEFRQAIEMDIDSIMNIIKDAQSYFKLEGIDQWQDNYPNYETIALDIKNKNSYVCLKDGKIAGTAAVIFDGEETYDRIYEGKWIGDGKYTTIHRIAVDSNYKHMGIGGSILENVEKISLKKNIKSIRIDTHQQNAVMINFLSKNGFIYCGIIYLKDRSTRIAFEKIL